jgi:hypothetical protein
VLVVFALAPSGSETYREKREHGGS